MRTSCALRKATAQQAITKAHLLPQGRYKWVVGSTALERAIRRRLEQPVHAVLHTGSPTEQMRWLGRTVTNKMGIPKLRISRDLGKQVFGIPTSKAFGAVVAIDSHPTPPATTAKRIIVLDGIQMPTNVAAIIESAVAFGWSDEVWITKGTADPYSSKVVDLCDALSVECRIFSSSLSTVLKRLEDNSVRVLVADTKLLSDSVQRAGDTLLDAPEPDALKSDCLALVLSSEGSGPSSELKGMPRVVVPMHGTESLNVGAAGAIIMKSLAEPLSLAPASNALPGPSASAVATALTSAVAAAEWLPAHPGYRFTVSGFSQVFREIPPDVKILSLSIVRGAKPYPSLKQIREALSSDTSQFPSFAGRDISSLVIHEKDWNTAQRELQLASATTRRQHFDGLGNVLQMYAEVESPKVYFPSDAMAAPPPRRLIFIDSTVSEAPALIRTAVALGWSEEIWLTNGAFKAVSSIEGTRASSATVLSARIVRKADFEQFEQRCEQIQAQVVQMGDEIDRRRPVALVFSDTTRIDGLNVSLRTAAALLMSAFRPDV